MAHARLAVASRHLVDLGLGRLHAGEVRSRDERRLAHEAGNGCMRALARGAAGAVGHRYEARPQRLEPPDRVPQRLLHLLRLGREELEGDIDVAVADQAAAALWAVSVHLGRALQLALAPHRPSAIAAFCGRRASHTETVRFAVPVMIGRRSSRVSTSSSPQSASHCPTCWVEKPRRSCANCSRRNSSSWGAKSTIEQASARRQHARRLAHGALRVAQEVQHLVHDRGADRLVGQRQIVDVALPHVGAPGLAAFELGARVGQHGRAQVDAEAAAIALAEQLEHAARAGAEVEEEIERAGAQRLRDHGLHVRLGHVQGADAVPFAGVGLEVGLSRLLALLAAGPRRAAGRGQASDRRGPRPRAPAAPAPRPRRPRPAGNTPSCLPARARPDPASASSFRCRLMRGWLCPRMPVRSLTLSSPDASSTSRRSRVGSAMAFRATTELCTGNCTHVSIPRKPKHIKISLYVKPLEWGRLGASASRVEEQFASRRT